MTSGRGTGKQEQQRLDNIRCHRRRNKTNKRKKNRGGSQGTDLRGGRRSTSRSIQSSNKKEVANSSTLPFANKQGNVTTP